MILVAVVADTHLPRGARRLPDECLERLRAADVIVHAGDFVRYEVLTFLRELGPPVVAVHGNMDDGRLRAELPEAGTFGVAGTRIGVVHDAGRRVGRVERLVERFPGCEVVVYGHTHIPQVVRHGTTWVVNPGSPTERRRAPVRSMAEIRLGAGDTRPSLVELPA